MSLVCDIKFRNPELSSLINIHKFTNSNGRCIYAAMSKHSDCQER